MVIFVYMIDITKYKQRLLEEKDKLEKELATLGRKNPDNQDDWEAVEPDMNTDTADEEDRADAIEAYETNTAILNNLEIRLSDVQIALDKIEKGNYGICEVSGQEIESDRLDANPAAKTAKAFM